MISKFMQIVRETCPDISEQDLPLPVRDTGIDSIDLVVIRVALEKHFCHQVTDKDWFQLTTLEDILQYFTEKETGLKTKSRPVKKIGVKKKIEIAMPQMANNALSENWLLKELGDLHWKLLSDGLEQKSKEFKDETGNRLYATFTRIAYSCSPLNNFRENDLVHLKGAIKRFGSATYMSDIDGETQKSFLSAKLMTSFSARSFNDNSKIEKSNPQEKINHIEEIKTTPEFLNNYRLLRKNLIDTWETPEYRFPVNSNTIFEHKHQINPYYEINGVGLLYFAAYPIISDFTLSNFFSTRLDITNWIENYQTIRRDINYFGNCNVHETIVARLNSFEFIDNAVKISSSLSRLSDQVTIARIFTVKVKTS